MLMSLFLRRAYSIPKNPQLFQIKYNYSQPFYELPQKAFDLVFLCCVCNAYSELTLLKFFLAPVALLTPRQITTDSAQSSSKKC